MTEIINPYNPQKFKQEFSQTEIFKAIERDHDLAYWEKYFNWPGVRMTTREIVSQRKIAIMVSFYFVNLIAENNDKPIYDIGCGGNYFKKYYPNIIGIDQPGNPNADRVGVFNEDYAKLNVNSFDNAIAICSLHFVSFPKINEQFRLFVDTIKPGGRGLFTINAIHPYHMSTGEEKQMYNVNSTADTINYIDKTLDFSGLTILSYDSPNINDPNGKIFFGDNQNGIHNEGMTGNIRIAFQKDKDI